MAGPYLKSGESIILTTDRVMIDDMEYDLILTSQRLALVDSDHISDQPQVVPFTTILSVKGGTTPAREPFITLVVIDPIGIEDSKTLDLIFSQQPYEDRSAECDLWVKKLIEHIVSVRDLPRASARQPAAEKPQGIHPTIRRFEAPEMPRPHSQVARESRRPSGDLLSAIQEIPWEKPDAAKEETVVAEQEATVQEDSPAPGPENVPRSTAPGSEEEKTVYTSPSDEPGSPADSAEVNSPAISGEGTPSAFVQEKDFPDTEERTDQVAVPATPFGELVPRMTGGMQEYPAPVLPDDNKAKSSQPPEEEQFPAIPATDIKEAEEPPGDDGTGRPAPAGEPLESAGSAQVQADHTDVSRPGSKESIGIPDDVVFPVISAAPPDTGAETPPANILPPARNPAGEPSVPRPGKISALAMTAIAIVLLIIVGATVIVLLYPGGNASGATIPAITPSLTPLPVMTASPVAIPPEGVWVKVTYNGTYYGKYGNPGSLIEVRGTGEQFYPVKDSSGLVQATFQKLDYSGNNLTVEVYNNGTMLIRIFKNSPAGEVNLLVNSTTGKPPFVPVTTAGA